MDTPTLPPSAWPALCGLIVIQPAWDGIVSDVCPLPATPERLALLIAVVNGSATLLLLDGTLTVTQTNGLRFADPSDAWKRVRRFVSGGEPKAEQTFEAT